jgi:type IV secretory pathway VirB2 component (pilin)
VAVYGLILLLASLVAAMMCHHIAFRSDMMHASISMETRKRIWKKVIVGPIAFFLAIMMGLVHPLVPIFVYILMPFFFMFMPAINIMEGMDPEERN